MLDIRTFLFALTISLAMHNETHALWFEQGTLQQRLSDRSQAMIEQAEYDKFEKEHAKYQREVINQLLAHIPIVDLNNVITSYSKMNFSEFQAMQLKRQRKQKIKDRFNLLIKEYQIQETKEENN